MPHQSTPRSILVTGVAGFIGSHVAKLLLEQDNEVIGVDSLTDYYSVKLKHDRLAWLHTYPHFHFHCQDVADTQAMKVIFKAQPLSAICHLAAQAGVRYSLDHPYEYIQSNILGTTVIFEQAQCFKVPHVVYASSSSVYGNTATPPFKEDQPTDSPISLYAASKKAGEVIAYSYHHLYGVQTTGLRFFTVYGPWSRPDMAAYKFAKAILAEEPIDVYNHGKMQRDFTYVEDIARGVVAALNLPLSYELINLGGSHVTELSYFIELLEKNLGKKAKRKFLPLQPGDVLLTSADTSKAQQLLGWEPLVSLEDGVEKFCTWFKEYHA